MTTTSPVTTDPGTRAAEVLRTWALDEDLKARVMSDPVLAHVARRVARRYTAGDTLDEALAAARAVVARGHAVSLDHVGESVRSADVADAGTDVFLALAAAIAASGLDSTVSFDLSHVGSVVDPELGLRNARRLAEATAPLGSDLMISAEGSDRTDLVLDLYERLAADHPHVGITLQVRLHRTPDDLARVMHLPGRVRLVKGAFLEPTSAALARDTPELHARYLSLAAKLVESGHATSVATHDDVLLAGLAAQHRDALREEHVEFETLLGLGTATLDRLRATGHRTREYVIFGPQWWLYVLNRIAEHPDRLLDAVVDLGTRP